MAVDPNAPDFRGGYAGEATFAGGGGYDPFSAQNYTGPVAPDFRGGYAGEQTVPGGGGFDRDIGSTPTVTKPDGTLVESVGTPSNVSIGSASRSTDTVPTSPYGTTDSATIVPSLLSSGTNGTKISTKTYGKNLSNIVQNPLEQFASYSPLWTLAVLEKSQFNNPPSYRNSPADLKHIVFSSGGRFDSQRQSTAYGVPEYFVNNFVMTSVIAPGPKTGNSNAIKFEFDIYEPQSMGLLLQSLQAAAIEAGYSNYLDNAPYVLRLDFQGYDDSGASMTSVKPKFFTLKLTKVTFQVNETGATYKVEAVPYNHIAFSDSLDVTYNDLTLIVGSKGTVEEILNSGDRSLAKSLNEIERNLVQAGRMDIPDEYLIEFPESSSDYTSLGGSSAVDKRATSSPGSPPAEVIKGTSVPASTVFSVNNIGSSGFGFDQATGGNFPFARAGDAIDEKNGIVKRDFLTIDVKKRTFQFAQSQKLTHIINQIILSSEYAKKAMDPTNWVDGFIKWWRIDVQIELIEYDASIGDYARRFRFRVVPFMVHHTIFSNANSAPIGYDKIEQKIVKEYNYIFTGKNSDVLKFDINIDNLFYRGINPSPENTSALNSDPNQHGMVEQTNKTTATGEGSSPATQLTNTLRARPKKSPDNLKAYSGGGGTTANTEQRIAESFHKALLQGADNIKVDLEILGDTYWLVESGMGNYFSPAGSTSQITADGTVNYEDGDVFVYLTFETPLDINENKGLYDFPTLNGTRTSQFSGIYRVVKCESQFSEGMFKQKLQCLRMVSQAVDFNDGSIPTSEIKPDKTTSPAVVIGPDGTPNTSISAYPNYNTGIK